jgi:hypothetical protein
MRIEKEFLLGFTSDKEVVFGEVRYDTENKQFSATFTTCYPEAIGQEEAIAAIEGVTESMSTRDILGKLEYYDCKPSELPTKIYEDTYNVVEEFFDNSLYTESFEIEGVDDTIYFLGSAFGQHDTRGKMATYINQELYDNLHELWDEYHLKAVPQEVEDRVNKLLEAIEHQNNTIDNEKVVENWLIRNFEK